MYLKWYSIIVGVILILAGLDAWLPTGPGIMVMPTSGIVAIIVGVIGIVLGLMAKERAKKEAVVKTPPETPLTTP